MSVLHPTKKIEVVSPSYAQKFACIGSDCEDSCCAGWTVSIDKKTYQAYRQIKNPVLADRFNTEISRNRSQGSTSNYARMNMLPVSHACPMLGDKLCSIQKELGEDKLSNTCFTYPRTSYVAGNFQQQSLTLSCPEAARLALLDQDAFEFSTGQVHVRPETLFTLKPMFGFSVEQMNDIRFACIKIMKSEGLELWQKMIFLGLLCESLTSISKNRNQQKALETIEGLFSLLNAGEFDELFSHTVPNHELQAEVFLRLWGIKTASSHSENQQIVHDRIAQSFQSVNDTISISKSQLVETYQAGLRGLTEVLQDKPFFFDNYLINEMFRECFPFGSASPLDHYLKLVVRFGMVRFMTSVQCADVNQLPDQDQMVRTVQVFCRRYQHDSQFASTVNGCFDQAGWHDLHKIFRLLKS